MKKYIEMRFREDELTKVKETWKQIASVYEWYDLDETPLYDIEEVFCFLIH